MFRVIAFVLLPVLFLSGVVHAGKNLPEGHNEKLEQLRERISELKNELASMRGQRDDLQGALEKAEKDIGAVAASLRRLDGQADQSRKDIRELQRNFDTEQLKLDKMRVTLENELRVAYMAGKQEQIKLLLNQQEPAALGRLMVYHKYFMRARAQAMQDIRATLARLADIERELLVQRSGIEVLIEQQQEKSSRLLARQAQRSEILLQLQDRLTGKTSRLAALGNKRYFSASWRIRITALTQGQASLAGCRSYIHALWRTSRFRETALAWCTHNFAQWR
jgi:septal ring factor EnvC (AmiA/AmiB activator)